MEIKNNVQSYEINNSWPNKKEKDFLSESCYIEMNESNKQKESDY